MLSTKSIRSPLIETIRNGRAVIGLELANPDNPMLAYLRYFFGKIPVPSLRFVHVIPRVEFFFTSEATSMALDEKILAAMQAEISAVFPKADQVDAELEVKVGDPLEGLLAEIEEENADLAVIGRREEGSHNIKARKLTRRAKCPVLIVPEEAETELMHLMVPVDFSEHSVQALKTALAIREAVNPEARISCVHVYEMPDLSPYRIQRTPDEMRSMVEEDRREALKIFLGEHVGDKRERVNTILIHKNRPGIANYLLEYADDAEVDFIVMGAKGHSSLELLLLGSVADDLITENEEIPLLVVKI